MAANRETRRVAMAANAAFARLMDGGRAKSAGSLAVVTGLGRAGAAMVWGLGLFATGVGGRASREAS